MPTLSEKLQAAVNATAAATEAAEARVMVAIGERDARIDTLEARIEALENPNPPPSLQATPGDRSVRLSWT